MSELLIGTNTTGVPFRIPIEAVTQTFGFLAKRGSGKTYAASVLAEELLQAGQRICAIDPIGVWWGLRASADGLEPGFPVVVFGGEHADVPIGEDAGGLLAELLAAEHLSCIIDISEFTQAQKHRFVADFADTLYRQNRMPLHLFLDEADEFAPQVAMHEERRMLHAVDRLVRRGRFRGLGVTLITQRPAAIHKNVLSQIEVLIALRLTSSQDRKAVEAWISAQADDAQRQTIMASLPGLPIGEAWIWSPGWLGVLERVQIRKRATFDSSATPKVGEQVRQPERLAEVDIVALRERFAAVADAQQADDPATLRRRIAELERQVDQRLATVERVEVPVLQEAQLDRLQEAIQAYQNLNDAFTTLAHQIAETAAEAQQALGAIAQELGRSQQALASPPPAPAAPKRARLEPAPTWTDPDAPPKQLAAPQQRILDALLAFEALGLRQVARQHVAIWSKQSPTSSGYSNNLGSLRSSGLIVYPAGGMLALSEVGRSRARATVSIASLTELHEAWIAHLPAPQGRILRAVIACYPKALDRTTLAEQTEQSPTSSGYSNNIGALRSLDLVFYPSHGQVAATTILFPRLSLNKEV